MLNKCGNYGSVEACIASTVKVVGSILIYGFQRVMLGLSCQIGLKKSHGETGSDYKNEIQRGPFISCRWNTLFQIIACCVFLFF